MEEEEKQVSDGATVLVLREAGVGGWEARISAKAGKGEIQEKDDASRALVTPAQLLPWASPAQPRKRTHQPPGARPQRPLSPLKGPT